VSQRVRLWLFGLAALVLAGWLTAAALQLPHFGTSSHPYGARAVSAALKQRTSNSVSSVNFDQRALDTLGEESILFASVLGAVLLLRLARGEQEHRPRPAPVMPSTRLLGTVLLPVTLLVGGYLVAHGALSPGGGFQGGAVAATGLHLSYVAADYRVLKRVRPMALLDAADAVAAGCFTVLGLAGLAVGASFLSNILPLGQFRDLASSGLVPLFNAVVGAEVASGLIVVLAHFLEQAVEVAPDTDETA
jgi:multicomponent Na+:H+ antiporter subunit B